MKTIYRLLIFELITLALTLLLSPQILAEGTGNGGGGGDDIGLEVRQVIHHVSRIVREHGSLFAASERQQLLRALRLEPRILVLDEALPASVNGNEQMGIQNGVMYTSNQNGTPFIRVNRARWRQMIDPIAIESLVCHELAVFATLEATGDYRLCSRYAEVAREFWNRRQSENILCSATHVRSAQPGASRVQMLGSKAIAGNLYDINSGAEMITRVDRNRGLVMKYVINGRGYLRAQFSIASIEGGIVSLRGEQQLTRELTFYTPYDWVTSPRGSTVVSLGEHGEVLVGCAKIGVAE